MHPAEIQFALKRLGTNQARIAEECGVAANTVSAVIHGRTRSQQIERRIAEVTGIPEAQLWPQWHEPGQLPGVAGLTAVERDLLVRIRRLSLEDQVELLQELLRAESTRGKSGRTVVASGSGAIAVGGRVSSEVHQHHSPTKRAIKKRS